MPEFFASLGFEAPTGLLVTVCLVALTLSTLATPVMRRVARRLGFVDRPAPRKGHRVPVPLLGGVAVGVAVLGALLVPGYAVAGAGAGGAILLGAALMALLGLIDDHRSLDAGLKLGVQALAAVVLILGGIRVDLPLPLWANVLLSIFWVVGVTNAFNLLDNMDGLSAGVGGIAALAMAGLAFGHGQVGTALLAAALAGACGGFLLYNFAPASIYLGDAGSLFLGFLLAALGIELRFPSNVNWITWMVPILVLGVPIFDTTLVVVSRLRRDLDPLRTPSRDHLSHRLVLLGLSPRRAVLTIYAVVVLLTLIATVVSRSDLLLAYTLGAGVFVAALVALWWLERPILVEQLRRLDAGRRPSAD